MVDPASCPMSHGIGSMDKTEAMMDVDGISDTRLSESCIYKIKCRKKSDQPVYLKLSTTQCRFLLLFEFWEAENCQSTEALANDG